MCNSRMKFCAGIHLVLFCAAVVWLMPPGSVARVIDRLNETFEFIYSPVPFENYYMLKDAIAETSARRLILMFFVTAAPGYAVGYLLSLRYFTKGENVHA